MNPQQLKALVRLSMAFALCKKAGICFCGMDDNLLAYDRPSFLEKLDEGKSSYDAQMDLGQGADVNHHGCYVDSGGW